MPTQLESDVQTSEDAFRTEVRQFLATNFPDELKGTGNMMAGLDGPTDENPVQKKWREAVGGRGWGTPTWPKEYGGGGLTKGQARIIEHEFAKVEVTGQPERLYSTLVRGITKLPVRLHAR